MVKEQARAIVERLPKDATWDDVMRELYIEAQEAAVATAAERRAGESSGGTRTTRRRGASSPNTKDALGAERRGES